MRALPGALLLAGALLLGAAGPAPQPHRTVLAAIPIARLDLPWWRARHEAVLHRLKQNPPELIFLGDSITQDWELRGPQPWRDFQPAWNRFYGDRNAANLGFIGDTTASLLWRIENGEVAAISPRVAVVLIGANNLGRLHWSADDTLAGIAAILTELHRRLPHTKLLLIGILPSERSAWATQTTLTVNRALAERYKPGGEVTFLDVGHVFMKGGQLDRTMFLDPLLPTPQDPLHPTAAAQEKLAEAIEPTLSALLGDRNKVTRR
jgi:lysophospholipase L1-like esterase